MDKHAKPESSQQPGLLSRGDETFVGGMDEETELRLRRNLGVALAIYIFGGVLMLVPEINDYPVLHTVLDTCVFLMSGILALLLWDMGSRIHQSFPRLLAVAFAATSACELIHALVVIEWSGDFAQIGEFSEWLRPGTWGPPAHLLPIGMVCALWLSRKNPPLFGLFSLGLCLLGLALIATFLRLPRYVEPPWFGISRPTLVIVPILWIGIGFYCRKMRAQDRIAQTLAMMAIILIVAHVVMLFSHAPHDTPAMIAHLGKFVGNLFLLLSLTQMGSADMAYRIRMERELLLANEALKIESQRAEEANQVKSEFLANMSHELRTPLNSIIGYSEFLSDCKPGALNSKQAEYVTVILKSGRHLLQLINDILDLAKVEAGKLELYPESFLLAQAIEEVCIVAKPMAQKKVVHVHIRVAADLGEVVIDQQKFKQVLFNLLSNAIKFTDENGRVDIIASLHDQEHFKLAVQDTGIGIKPEDLKRLFVDFGQLETVGGRRFEGTGLGLSLTKKIVLLQGGAIHVESEAGKGSTFTVVLPLKSEVKSATTT